MRLHAIKTDHTEKCVRVSCQCELESKATFHSGTQIETLWFEWPSEYFEPNSVCFDAFAVSILTIATSLGEDLTIDGKISNELLLNLQEAIAVYHWYFPKLSHEISIKGARISSTHRAHSHRVASFYSGGVDSLFNIAGLIRHKRIYGGHETSDLWLVHGMDIPLQDLELWNSVSTRLHEIQDLIPIQIVNIRTNARELQRGIVPWSQLGFSCILGGVSKLFSEFVPSVLIGSYDTYDRCVPHSSSPLVDHLWSCSRQSIRHYSARFSRLDKLEVIKGEMPGLLNILRVCWRNLGGEYNCGVCEKCLRTQAQLELVSARNLTASFPELDLYESIMDLEFSSSEKDSQYTIWYWKEIQIKARENGAQQLFTATSIMLMKNHYVYRLPQRFLRLRPNLRKVINRAVHPIIEWILLKNAAISSKRII